MGAVHYRNKIDVTSLEDIFVEECSLWMLDPEQDLLVRVDDDQYATHPLDGKFEKAL